MNKLSDALQPFKDKQSAMNLVFRPVLIRLSEPGKAEDFKKLLATPGISITDQIREQIRELVKIEHPQQKFSTNELEKQTNLKLKGAPEIEFGTWVYYPWSNRLVHILDERDFIEVRTNRNQYKITPGERTVLAAKKIGIIGLSVGQSVAVTLAMERVCTELRLADFDLLELTNLNRIRTGIHNLGLPKVFSVAREVAEIDPFIKVVCFPEGINDDNMDDFFTAGGKLDLLVEESDGFDIKILSRYKARELRIPVVMEGSDRCVLDIERFDLEPERDILHGLVNHLDLKELKELKTTEQKIPYMLDMIGLHTSSQRLKASMIEIDQSINTWPQLASAVTMGGGITADISRRILLGLFDESGRYHIDIEELVGNKKSAPAGEPKVNLVPLTTAQLAQTVESVKGKGLHLDEKQAGELVAAGCTAPSAGNLQPWRWVYRNNLLFLFNGTGPDQSVIGFKNLATNIALGMAAMNVVLQAEKKGLAVDLNILPDGDEGRLAVSFSFAGNAGLKKTGSKLADAIGTRITNRMLGKRQRIEKSFLTAMVQTVRAEGNEFDLSFFTGEEELDRLGDILGEIEKIRLLDPKAHREFVSEIRWTEEENDRTKDGVDIRTLDLSNTEKVGLEIARDGEVIKLLDNWKGGGAFKKLTKKAIDAAGAIGLMTVRKRSAANFIKGGMLMQKVWLEASSLGISLQPMAAPVFLYSPVMQGVSGGLSDETVKKLTRIRPEFERQFMIPENYSEFFIFRLSKCAEPEIRSLRKPIDELFSYYS